MSSKTATQATHARRGHGPMQARDKPKDFKKALGKLAVYCKRHWWSILIALVFAVAGTVLTVIGPSYIEEIVNELAAAISGLATGQPIRDVNIDLVWDTGLFLIIIYLLGAIFSIVQSQIMTTVTNKVAKRMRYDISTKINRLPLRYIDSHSYGDVLSRVTNDVDLISQTLNNSISTLVSSIALFLGSLIMMFVTNWILALCAIASSLLGFIIMALIMSKSQKHFNAQQESMGDINGHIEEIYSGHNVVKAYNGEKASKAKFDKINKSLYNSAWKSQFFSGTMMPLMNFIGNLGYVVVCVVGAVLALNGNIEFGVIAAFIIYVRLFTQPLSQMAQAFTNLQSASAASERVFEFLDEKEMTDESKKTENIQDIKGAVVFDHVKFGYDAKNFNLPKSPLVKQKEKQTLKASPINFKKAIAKYNPQKLIIKDFSIDIKAGQKVAIVGPTGAGKTTLVNLLMRFYDVDSGEIRIDGISTQNMTRQNVHELFSMVLQDTWIFDGTIKENIIYDKQGVTDEQVINAAKACGLDHFIRTLPQGYNTKLDENTTISAGQRQLITIARAMVQNGPMLILDEATSSVDTRTEIIIQQAMDALTQGRTSFIIAHRLSTIKNADVILVMKNGDIVEKGTHDELLAKGGAYAELYNSQFETY